jgi:hypothetical protein
LVILILKDEVEFRLTPAQSRLLAPCVSILIAGFSDGRSHGSVVTAAWGSLFYSLAGGLVVG